MEHKEKSGVVLLNILIKYNNKIAKVNLYMLTNKRIVEKTKLKSDIFLMHLKSIGKHLMNERSKNQKNQKLIAMLE